MKFQDWLLCLIFIAALPLTNIAQEARIFYDVCESNAQTYVDFQRDQITVNYLSDDSIAFVSVSTLYTCKKVPGFNFLEGGRDVYHFYAYKVDDNSFVIASAGMDAFCYYNADKNIKNETDNNKRCAVASLNKFDDLVKAYKKREDEASEASQKEFDSQTKGVITDFIKNYKSKRSDSQLEKGIRAWWRGSPDAVVINPILHIYFLQPDYEFTRNELGVVLRKTVDAIIVFKMKNDGKCYMQWRSFGYESLGGAVFDTSVKDWIKKDLVGFDYYPRYLKLEGDRHIIAGHWYEVDCDSFK